MHGPVQDAAYREPPRIIDRTPGLFAQIHPDYAVGVAEALKAG
jgi:hypothetical protein